MFASRANGDHIETSSGPGYELLGEKVLAIAAITGVRVTNVTRSIWSLMEAARKINQILPLI